MARGILEGLHAKRNSYSKTMPFIQKGAVSSVIKDTIFHLLEPS